MNTGGNSPRVPSLLELCQRVGSKHSDLVVDVGDISYELVKPILETDVHTLERLERSSPHLKCHTAEIWDSLSNRDNLINETNIPHHVQLPASARDRYYFFKEQGALRFNQTNQKLQSLQREEDSRQRSKKTKRTDRVLKEKRPRFTPPAPKTLLGKARTDASKVQRTVAPVRGLFIPPTRSKPSPVLPKPSLNLISHAKDSTNNVKVTTVVKRVSTEPSFSQSGANLRSVTWSRETFWSSPPYGSSPMYSRTSSASGSSSSKLPQQSRPSGVSHLHPQQDELKSSITQKSAQTHPPSSLDRSNSSPPAFKDRGHLTPPASQEQQSSKHTLYSSPTPPPPYSELDRPIRPLPSPKKDLHSLLFIPKPRARSKAF